jgi:hypothetical protein
MLLSLGTDVESAFLTAEIEHKLKERCSPK